MPGEIPVASSALTAMTSNAIGTGNNTAIIATKVSESSEYSSKVSFSNGSVSIRAAPKKPAANIIGTAILKR